MLAESAAITDVIDAFDLGSVWSLRFSAGYSSSIRTATLQRERSTITSGMNPAPSPSGVTEFDNVARYRQVVQTLNLGLSLAIFHDLAATIGVPIILADEREFGGVSDASTAESNRRLRDGYTVDGTPSQLFQIPFQSPVRSGIDYIRFGLSWDILNQSRDPWLPTWLLHLEYRMPVGPQLHPCAAGPAGSGTHYCPAEEPPPGQQPIAGRFDPEGSTNWVNDPMPPDGRAPGTRAQQSAGPGISRRVHGFYALTAMSRRIGYLEPYIGLDFLIEIPERNIQFRFGDTPFGQLSNIPPVQGSFVAGTEIVPWENRESWQRFVIDVRVRGAYFSQGRDYSPLFDALGASNSQGLIQPSYAINDVLTNNTNRPVYFTGTTSTHSHAQFTGQLGLAFQAARFLRFTVGAAFSYTTPYLLTATDACNPNESPQSPAQRGGCVGNAVPDPLHRPVIDLPGQRFRMTEAFTYDLWVNLVLTPRF